MADREKVMKGLECCVKSIEDYECADNCPHESQCWDGTMYLDMMRDALELLKAQEPQYVYDCAEMIDDIVVGKCPSCDRTIVNKINDPTRFCKYCGQAVKWSEPPKEET